MATTFLTDKQYLKIKSSIIDTNNCLNKEFTSGFHLVNIFSGYFFSFDQLSFFKKNQQFITQSTRAVCDSYFVTMYKRGRCTWRKRKERKK